MSVMKEQPNESNILFIRLELTNLTPKKRRPFILANKSEKWNQRGKKFPRNFFATTCNYY